jgi:hypothetical protein
MRIKRDGPCKAETRPALVAVFDPARALPQLRRSWNASLLQRSERRVKGAARPKGNAVHLARSASGRLRS